MRSHQDIPWNRIAAEAIAIVAAILLAFAIDTWWEERQERSVERDELTRLLEEFISNKDTFDTRDFDNSETGRRIASAALLSSAVQSAVAKGLEFISVRDIDLANVLITPTIEIETTVFDSLVRSGKLEVVQESNIVESLGSWERSYRGVLESQRDEREFVMNQFFPLIAENNNIEEIVINKYFRTRVTELESNGETRIVVDPKLSNMFANRLFWLRLVQSQWETVGSNGERVILEVSEFLNN